jgi:hypothetical protein
MEDSSNLLSDINIEVEWPASCADNAQSEILTKVAKSFSINAKDILGLLSLPLILVSVGVAENRRTALFAKAIVSTKNVSRWEKSEVARQEVENEVQRLFADMNVSNPVVGEATNQLQHLLAFNEVNSSARFLLLAAISSAWTALECLAKDLWVVSLNSRPINLAHRAFQSISFDGATDGLTGRSITVGLLARHGFDLRSCLGTLLSSKFDFSGMKGIREAYFAAYGKSPELENILANKDLETLEAIRHLIVHRGGIIDAEFKRRAKPDAVEGELLALDGKIVSNLTNGAIHAGCDLLEFVDEWLVNNPPIERGEGS